MPGRFDLFVIASIAKQSSSRADGSLRSALGLAMTIVGAVA